jgi:aldehyde:ferredoxin oxidoreductase
MMESAERQRQKDMKEFFGYAGKILRIDLTKGATAPEALTEEFLKDYIGGAAMGIKYIYDEVDPKADWTDPNNRLFIGSGPLGGTRVAGSGTVCVVTKGALTNGMASSQANGFFGAYLKFLGYDAIIIQGAASKLCYLYIHDGIAELKDAAHLAGKTTFETEDILKKELGKKERSASVLCIGPAGENMVKFALIFVDGGHMASHNGVGAVMGSKKLKAIVIDRGKKRPAVHDKEELSVIAKELVDNALKDKMNYGTHQEGTVGGVIMSTKGGMVPVRNYMTNVSPMPDEKLEKYSAQNIRAIFNARRTPCWACPANHCQSYEITEGKYAGRKFEEPEYEGMAAFSELVGINDVETTVLLAGEVDHIGIDINETGWVIAFTMECYEKGILTRDDTNGLEMTWGNGEAVMAMLKKIANREGFGDVLAEGVMRAARKIGGEAPNMAVHTMKGNSPRGHDHRVMWQELFDTCVSNLGTLEAHSIAPYELLGIPPNFNRFDPIAVSTVNAKIKGSMVFEDSLVTCRFNTINALELLCRAVKAVTGWDMDHNDAMRIGKRAVNLARTFNLLAGISAKLDAPSPRYGSTPIDGKAAGMGIMEHWDKMLKSYYSAMGWDENTGIPLPETLKKLGIGDAIAKLWS